MRREISSRIVAWFVLSLLGSPSHAQELADLLPADQAGMEQCLTSADERGARKEECIGFVQGPCTDTDEGQTPEGIIQCLAREHGYWDRLLNQSYHRLQATIEEDEKNTLRDLQRQWLAWRDARCQWETFRHEEGGSLAQIVANECYTEETARRAIDLTEAIVEGGDYRLESSN